MVELRPYSLYTAHLLESGARFFRRLHSVEEDHVFGVGGKRTFLHSLEGVVDAFVEKLPGERGYLPLMVDMDHVVDERIYESRHLHLFIDAEEAFHGFGAHIFDAGVEVGVAVPEGGSGHHDGGELDVDAFQDLVGGGGGAGGGYGEEFSAGYGVVEETDGGVRKTGVGLEQCAVEIADK